MELIGGAFRFGLTPLRKVDDEDWVRVQVDLATGEFTGNFDAYLQLEDLKRFEREVTAMYANPVPPAQAQLSSAEPNVFLELAAASTGSIVGRYRMIGEQGDAAELTGEFKIDQSFLPAIRTGISALVAELGDANAA